VNIGERIRALREQEKYTLEELAHLVGTTKQTIFKYENGIVTNIPLDKIEAIAKAFDVSPAYIMGWEEKKPVEGLSNSANDIFNLVKDCPEEQAARLLQVMKLFLESERVKR
jgi:transcriptional regulator with XRE-family HTH domain